MFVLENVRGIDVRAIGEFRKYWRFKENLKNTLLEGGGYKNDLIHYDSIHYDSGPLGRLQTLPLN